MFRKTMLALMALAGLLGASVNDAHAGVVGGVKEGMIPVPAFDSVVIEFTFLGGELATALVSGDTDTDLDVYVYDERGRLVGFDDDESDVGIVHWIPSKTGKYYIVIENLGRVYNEAYVSII